VAEEFGKPERVYVEGDWFDGPRSGVADVGGVPHRFVSVFDDATDDYTDVYLVWPINEASLAMEHELWKIFVEWHKQYKQGAATTANHPAHGRISARWDELEPISRKEYKTVPEGARKALGKVEAVLGSSLYEVEGVGYRMRWSIIDDPGAI